MRIGDREDHDMARDWSKDNRQEGSKRRLRGTGGALFNVIGKIGKKLAGKTDGWGEEYTGETRHEDGKRR